MDEKTWYLRTQDETFGPEAKEKLIEWAEMGRIQPGQEVSDDEILWQRVEDVPFLDMRFSIDIGDGNPRGPFNRRAAEALLASGRLPPAAKLVEVREPFADDADVPVDASETPAPAETAVPPAGKPMEVPVLRQDGLPGLEVEEKREVPAVNADVPVDADAPSASEKDGSAELDVVAAPAPAEKDESVELDVAVTPAPAENVVVDDSRVKELDSRVKELEELLEKERRRADGLQVRLDAATKDAETQLEEFQQKTEAAAQEAASQLEAARQKSEIAAQDAEAHLAAVQNESAARLAETERNLETVKKEAAEQLAAAQQKLEAAQKDFAEQSESARRKAEDALKDAEARLEAVRQESATRLEEVRQESATRLAEVRQKAEAEAKETAARLADVQANAERVQKDADEREKKSREQIVALENELRRLPQAASEIADVQAAVYSIMTKEAAELAELIETEKRESDEFRRRQQERADRMLERRRELLKRTGANIEDMTRKALVERPEDPRMTQLRREYEEFRRADEKKSRAYEDKILAKSREIEELRREISRRNVSDKDATQLQAEVVSLTERLQRCEKDLLSERQLCEELRQRQATNQQVLMARLATLETPSIAPANAAHQQTETRQSREAKAVKLPRWMTLGGKR